ncbi:YczE/YyaS/YitT family protein [Cellulosilyticum sp. I15G10I2]|uniref:YczE/YyaS/YitT family protein n=1 Tax=Cellulosilyticum sp. I15G10I2 TaxID=1892843 RepID=UPI00085C48B0|nr:DUF6198 family protein [Cellulosilyticum sp. I15G10I2]
MRQILRLVIYMIGIGILSLGVIINTKTGLGVSALNSVPYVISYATGLSLGNITIVLYIFFIIAQAILMGRDFKVALLLQLPFSILFGRYTDFFNQFVQIEPTNIWSRIWLLAAAITLTALGVVLTVHMKIVPNAPEGLVQMLSEKLQKDFGYVKNWFDGIFVLISTICGFLLEGKIIGIGIGTIMAVLFVGRLVALFNKLYGEKLHVLLVAPQSQETTFTKEIVLTQEIKVSGIESHLN